MSYELTATSDYLRTHEAFLIRVDLSEYLVEYYLHRKDHAPSTSAEHDEKLKELIACFAIHLANRTTLETHAWTVHIVADQPYSLFVTGSTGEIDESGIAHGFLVGHVLTDNIRHSDTNALHAQFTHRGKTFKSFVRCDTSDIREMVEAFYRQSEQRPIRINLSSNSDTAMGLAALPGYDPDWFGSADIEQLTSTPELERAAMRSCRFSFRCDCSPEKLLPFFSALSSETLDELYGKDEALVISCPRCGRQFTVPRADIGAREQ